MLRLLRDEYPHYTISGTRHVLEGSVASAALFGSIFGQLVAGSLADIWGRKILFVTTAILISVGSIGSAFCTDSPAFTIYGQIACWRFLLGAGVGGEYPLAATVTSESSSASSRGRLMSAVFAMQGVGALSSVLIVLFCLGSGFSPGFAWRFALAFGSVPALLAFPWRLRMHETETFERVKHERTLTEGDRVDANNSTYGATTTAPLQTSGRWVEITNAFRLYKWHMLGTASCWFLLDVVFYANGLFNHDITSLILSKGRHTTVSEDAWNSAFICAMGLPGYGLSFMFIDQVGRKNIQLMGFIIMGVLFCICGYGRNWFLTDELGYEYRQWLFLFFYSLTFLFSNFGPNTTTFVIPGEIFPANVRATAHGLSAASGKLGAAAGAYFFPMLLGPGGSADPTPTGLQTAMITCGVVAWLGAVMTYWFTPRYGAEQLEDEDYYHALEHACLQPASDEFKSLLSSASQYEMVQVVDRFHSIDDLSTHPDHDGEGGVSI